MHLPRLIVSPKMKAELKMVKAKANGWDMAKNTGPFFSITHACK